MPPHLKRRCLSFLFRDHKIDGKQLNEQARIQFQGVGFDPCISGVTYICIYIYVYIDIDQSINLSIYLSIYPAIPLSIYLSIYLSFFLSSFFLSFLLSFFLSYLSIHLTISLSLSLFYDLLCIYIYIPLKKTNNWAAFKASEKSTGVWRTLRPLDSMKNQH